MIDTANKYFSGDSLLCFPKKSSAKRDVLKIIINKFDEDKIYNEREVNEILKKIYDDYILIRRSLVEYSFLCRTDDGSKYWKAKD